MVSLMHPPYKSEKWIAATATVVGSLKQGWRAFLGFGVMVRLVSLTVFTPLLALLGSAILQLTGDGAISNYEIISFLLSPSGIVYSFVIVTAAFVVTFFECGGLVALAIALLRGREVRLPLLMWFLIRRLPGLWRLALRQFVGYLIIGLPCLAVVAIAYALLLTRSDIYFYLVAKPPEFRLAAAIAIIAGLVFIVLAVRKFIDWIYALPLVLFSGVSPAKAMKQSREMVEGRRWVVFQHLLIWAASVGVLWLLSWAVLETLKFVLLFLAAEKVSLVLIVTAALGLLAFLASALVFMISAAGLATGVAIGFVERRPDVVLPDSIFGEGILIFQKLVRLLRAGWVLVLLAGGVVVAMSILLINQVNLEEQTGITAHRGSSVTAPENTMAAILLAIEEGADYVEIDVQETKDGTVVLAHDKDLRRVFGIRKGIWEVTYDEIRNLDSGGWFSPEFSDQRISTLAEVIRAVKGRARLNIELKFNGHQKQLAAEVVRIVREENFVNQCILTSLDKAGLKRARNAGPEFRTGLIVTSSIGDSTKLEGDLISVGASTVTRAFVDRAERKGLEVHVWTVNDVATMNLMAGLGVDQIITDEPLLLHEVLKEREELTTSEKILLQISDLGRGWL